MEKQIISLPVHPFLRIIFCNIRLEETHEVLTDLILISIFYSVTGPPRPRRMMRETFSSSIEETVPVKTNTTLDAGIPL